MPCHVRDVLRFGCHTQNFSQLLLSSIHQKALRNKLCRSIGTPSESQSNLCWHLVHLTLPSPWFEGHPLCHHSAAVTWDFKHLCQLVLYESQNVAWLWCPRLPDIASSSLPICKGHCSDWRHLVISPRMLMRVYLLSCLSRILIHYQAGFDEGEHIVFCTRKI